MQQTVFFGHCPRIAVPVLAIDRYHIAMAGQDDAPFNIGTNGGVEIGLGPVGTDDARRGNAMFGKIILDPRDQLKIAVPRGGVEGDQFC